MSSFFLSFLNKWVFLFLDISIFHRYFIPNSILAHFDLNAKKLPTQYILHPLVEFGKLTFC